MTGVSAGAPAASRCAGVSVAFEIVRMPTRRPGGSSRSISGACIKAEVATGTPQAAAIWF